jgi:hypothetical protein
MFWTRDPTKPPRDAWRSVMYPVPTEGLQRFECPTAHQAISDLPVEQSFHPFGKTRYACLPVNPFQREMRAHVNGDTLWLHHGPYT